MLTRLLHRISVSDVLIVNTALGHSLIHLPRSVSTHDRRIIYFILLYLHHVSRYRHLP